MAAALPFIMAASAAVSAISALQQGSAAKSAAQFNAQVADQNAQLSRQNAEDQVVQQQRETYMRIGAIRAAQGASGGAGSGSVLDVIGDVAAQSELEKQQIRYRGELAARGYANTSALDTYSGKTAQSGSYFKAGSELLSGGAKAYKAYDALAPSGGMGNYSIGGVP